jgi:3-hydroxyisobutyrate dehydrogenase-like beta-hydroxyacid dehydrogenase
MSDVAVIGIGGMGSRIARRLLDAGHDVAVWNRTAERTRPLVEAGATAGGTPAQVARSAEAVLTMVADPAALREVTEGPDGVIAGVSDRTTLIEMSTVGPDAVLRLASRLPAGTRILDAPVLGSLSEAEGGTLRVFVGGDDADMARWTPLFAALGTPMHVGPVGAGAAAKLVANSTLVGVLGVLGEALALADGVGLPRNVAFDVLATTAIGAQVDRRRTAIESGEFPHRFSLSLGRKDADLIAAAASEAKVDVRVLEAARSWLADADAAGWGDRDYSSVLAYILGDEPRGPAARR